MRTLLSDGYPDLCGRRRHRARQPDLRRQPGQPRAGRGQPALHLRARRHLRPGAARRGAPGSRRRPELRRRVPRRPVDQRRGQLRHDQRLGTQTLLDAACGAGIPRFVHVSTDEVYGSIADGSFRETDRLEPNSPYSAAKAGGDLIARSLRHHPRPRRRRHPLHQQLRAVPVPGEGHPAVRHQPARRPVGAAVRRRPQRPRLAARRRPLPRHRHGARAAGAPARSTTSAAASR